MKISKFVDSMKAFQENMKAEGQKILTETFKELFDKFPELEAIGWAQYAPYFNDGEPCEFSVRPMSYRVKSDGPPLEKNDLTTHIDDILPHNYWSSYDVNNKPTALHNSISEVSNALQGMEDIARALFGDDNVVIVTRDKVNVLDYSGGHE